MFPHVALDIFTLIFFFGFGSRKMEVGVLVHVKQKKFVRLVYSYVEVAPSYGPPVGKSTLP